MTPAAAGGRAGPPQRRPAPLPCSRRPGIHSSPTFHDSAAMNIPRIASVVPVMASLLLLASCGDSGSDPVTPPAGLSLGSTSLTCRPGDTGPRAVGGEPPRTASARRRPAAVAAAFLSGTTLARGGPSPGEHVGGRRRRVEPAADGHASGDGRGQPPVSFRRADPADLQRIVRRNAMAGTAGLFLAAGSPTEAW